MDRKGSGPDHFYALEPDELKAYVTAIQETAPVISIAARKRNRAVEGIPFSRYGQGETLLLQT